MRLKLERSIIFLPLCVLKSLKMQSGWQVHRVLNRTITLYVAMNLSSPLSRTTMASLLETLEQQLVPHNLDIDDWRALLQRLLDYGVLCRDDSQVEAEFYDQFVRVQDLVDQYLSLMGVRFQHDPHFRFVRLIPPGARVPGLEDESDEPSGGGFRQRLSQHEIALILVLRAEYDKALCEGLIDEQGCAALSVAAVALAMKNLLRRALPENVGERRQEIGRAHV